MVDIKFKPLELKDLEFILEVRNDETTRKFLRDDRVFELNNAKEWYNDNKPEWLIILDSASGDKLGYFRIEGDLVGCDIHPSFRRRGIARKAYQLYLKDKKKAVLWVFEENFAINLYLSLGFRRTGKGQVIRGMNEVEMVYERSTA